MKIDFIPNINAFGDAVVRLYDFDREEAIKLKDEIEKVLIDEKRSLSLSDMECIEPMNCDLTLRINDEDLGIVSAKERTFFCDLTFEGYLNMMELIDPFCTRDTIGYQYLYDLDIPVDLLFSPAGAQVKDLI
jgi:hypothetical protein